MAADDVAQQRAQVVGQLTYERLPASVLDGRAGDRGTLELDRREHARKQLIALEEFAEERRHFIRDAGDLVRCLTIEFEIELGPGLAVIPVGEMFELAPP